MGAERAPAYEDHEASGARDEGGLWDSAYAADHDAAHDAARASRSSHRCHSFHCVAWKRDLWSSETEAFRAPAYEDDEACGARD